MSIFHGRRKQQRPVPAGANDYDPWNMRDDASSEDSQPSTSKSAAAVRIMSTMRRFSYGTQRKRERSHTEGGMYSTPAETSPPTMSPYSFHDRPDTRPTIEQIAMGLHISRTPHLLPPRSSSQPPHAHHISRRSVDVSPARFPPRPSIPSRHTSLPASASSPTLPPPPLRSSLKQTRRPPTADSSTLAPSASDASLSTLTSNGPSTPRSVQSASATSFPGKLRLEMLRLLPNRKGSLSGSISSRSASPGVMTPSSDADSLSSGRGVLTPKRKAVRFSAGVHDERTEEEA